MRWNYIPRAEEKEILACRPVIGLAPWCANNDIVLYPTHTTSQYPSLSCSNLMTYLRKHEICPGVISNQGINGFQFPSLLPARLCFSSSSSFLSHVGWIQKQFAVETFPSFVLLACEHAVFLTRCFAGHHLIISPLYPIQSDGFN